MGLGRGGDGWSWGELGVGACGRGGAKQLGGGAMVSIF